MVNRIKEIIAYYSLSNRAFSIKCGLKDNTFINQLNGVREISLNTINAILLSNEDISAEWLLRSKGEMLISANKQGDESTERISMLVDTIATLQKTINEKTKTVQLIEEKLRKTEGELAMLKNERNIG